MAAKRYRYAKAEYQLGMYEEVGVDYETSGQALDWSLAEATGEVAGSYIAKGISKGYNKVKSLSKSVLDDAGKASKRLFDIDLQQFNKGTGKGDKVTDVITETLDGKKNITSKHTLTADELLDAGEEFLGKGYKEIDTDVYRSNGGKGDRIFRIDDASLTGTHNPYTPHGHLEILKSNGKRKVNNHIPFIE